jgi:hypothetical protein
LCLGARQAGDDLELAPDSLLYTEAYRYRGLLRER